MRKIVCIALFVIISKAQAVSVDYYPNMNLKQYILQGEQSKEKELYIHLIPNTYYEESIEITSRKLKRVIIDGNSARVSKIAIELPEGDVKIKNLNVAGYNGRGIYIKSSINYTLDNVNIEDVSLAIEAHGSSGGTLNRVKSHKKGYGIVVDKVDGFWKITEVLIFSPAYAKAVMKWDVLLGINGKKAKYMTKEQIYRELKKDSISITLGRNNRRRKVYLKKREISQIYLYNGSYTHIYSSELGYLFNKPLRSKELLKHLKSETIIRYTKIRYSSPYFSTSVRYVRGKSVYALDLFYTVHKLFCAFFEFDCIGDELVSDEMMTVYRDALDGYSRLKTYFIESEDLPEEIVKARKFLKNGDYINATVMYKRFQSRLKNEGYFISNMDMVYLLFESTTRVVIEKYMASVNKWHDMLLLDTGPISWLGNNSETWKMIVDPGYTKNEIVFFEREVDKYKELYKEKKMAEKAVEDLVRFDIQVDSMEALYNFRKHVKKDVHNYFLNAEKIYALVHFDIPLMGAIVSFENKFAVGVFRIRTKLLGIKLFTEYKSFKKDAIINEYATLTPVMVSLAVSGTVHNVWEDINKEVKKAFSKEEYKEIEQRALTVPNWLNEFHEIRGY